MKNLKNKKGFTLIELIVVIAILGILALFLVPQFMGYSQDAKNQVAQANARTVWTAAKAAETSSEYKEFTGGDGTFIGEINDKLGNSFDDVSNTGNNSVTFDSKFHVTMVSYETNGVVCTYNGETFSKSCGGTRE